MRFYFYLFVLLLFATDSYAQIDLVKTLQTPEKSPKSVVMLIDSSTLLMPVKSFKTKIVDINVTRRFPDSIPDGQWIAYYEIDTSKIAFEMNFKNNLSDGLFIYFFASGNIMSFSNYSKGKIEGFSYFFNSNGYCTQIEHYENGIRNGIFVEYNEKGVKISETFWKDGEIVKRK